VPAKLAAWSREAGAFITTVKQTPLDRREGLMSQPTLSSSPGTRLNAAAFYGREASAIKSGLTSGAVMTTFVLGNAALATLSMILLFLLPNPWAAALIFAATYGLFWLSLVGGANTPREE
jgi:hypothetical protein